MAVALAVADTSFFIGREQGRTIEEDLVPDVLRVSVVTIGELRAGVLSAADLDTRQRRLVTLDIAASSRPVPIDQAVAESWARLRALLDERGRCMPVNDSWIAATAISLGIPVVTQDGDYDVDIPELAVIHL